MSEETKHVVAAVAILADALRDIATLDGPASAIAQNALEQFHEATRNL